jgi:hypothetical protein
MPTSLLDAAAETALKAARGSDEKRVRCNEDTVDISTPFPSPEDWRDQRVYFLMVGSGDKVYGAVAVKKRSANPQLQFKSKPARFQSSRSNGILQRRCGAEERARSATSLLRRPICLGLSPEAYNAVTISAGWECLPVIAPGLRRRTRRNRAGSEMK